MTEEERRGERERKTAVTAELAGNRQSYCDAWQPVLDATDSRLMVYLLSVVDNPTEHNLYEQLAVRRFFALLGKYKWRRKAVRNFFHFYETLRFSGVNGRQRYKLTPVQCFQFASIFGFEGDDGYRLTRTAYIFVPRKFSKTTSAASLAVYDLLFGDNNAQAYVGANSYEQAKICFDEIRAIMRDLDPQEKHFRVNREKITFRGRGRDSLIRCLTANAKTQDGLYASLVIMDEYAQARNTAGKNGADLKNVLTSSMGPRREPLTLIITTASDVVDGPFAHELDGVKRVLRGEVENDSIFASIFEPDADDKEDDPATWRKVQPHLGVTVRPDFYEREYRNALLSAENMLAFRTKLLNVFSVSDTKTWLPRERIDTLLSNFDIDKVVGHPDTAVAFDLSIHDDFSAVSYTYYSPQTKSFWSHTDYYFPEGALAGHPNERLYRTWHESGWLRLCKGDRIDARMIADDILRRSRNLRIVRIVYDQYKSQELVNILATVGGRANLQPYKQTYGEFNLPVETFESLAYASPPNIHLNANPINVFCLSNCVIDEDHLENKKPIKISRMRKIDGAITMLMTLGALGKYER